jgi:hypothetical protein
MGLAVVCKGKPPLRQTSFSEWTGRVHSFTHLYLQALATFFTSGAASPSLLENSGPISSHNSGALPLKTLAVRQALHWSLPLMLARVWWLHYSRGRRCASSSSAVHNVNWDKDTFSPLELPAGSTAFIHDARRRTPKANPTRRPVSGRG